MRPALAFLGFFIIAAFSSQAANLPARVQEHSYTSPKVEYVVEFPSPQVDGQDQEGVAELGDPRVEVSGGDLVSRLRLSVRKVVCER